MNADRDVNLSSHFQQTFSCYNRPMSSDEGAIARVVIPSQEYELLKLRHSRRSSFDSVCSLPYYQVSLTRGREVDESLGLVVITCTIESSSQALLWLL